MEIGQRFGKWTVLGRESRHKGGLYFNCRCDCGTVRAVRGSHLTGGKSSSCGCVPYPNLIPASERRIHVVRTRIKATAKRRGISYNLPDAVLGELIDQPCHYCGSTSMINTHAGRFHFSYQGLDRKSSRKGYTIDNVVPCCTSCNKKKGSLPYKEYLTLLSTTPPNRPSAG